MVAGTSIRMLVLSDRHLQQECQATSRFEVVADHNTCSQHRHTGLVYIMHRQGGSLDDRVARVGVVGRLDIGLVDFDANVVFEAQRKANDERDCPLQAGAVAAFIVSDL